LFFGRAFSSNTRTYEPVGRKSLQKAKGYATAAFPCPKTPKLKEMGEFGRVMISDS